MTSLMISFFPPWKTIFFIHLFFLHVSSAPLHCSYAQRNLFWILFNLTRSHCIYHFPIYFGLNQTKSDFIYRFPIDFSFNQTKSDSIYHFPIDFSLNQAKSECIYHSPNDFGLIPQNSKDIYPCACICEYFLAASDLGSLYHQR